ncbi:MAG: heme ABC exporter ATP-binding protein CcmA [Acidobacteria bacterium]|nr:heme ABC exporter ATP-binding protein CcmA [Acidobacteriota bacterium]
MSAVSVEGIWKFYGDYPALREIDFVVEEKQCLALLGRNGAGKTTMLRMLAGLLRPQRGTIRLFGRDSHEAEARASFGVLGHGIGVYDELSAMENLRLFAKVYSVPDAEKAAKDWLVRTQLDHVADSLVREFSRGMRQRLAVARAFLHNPSLLLLDEPFTALDDRAIALLQSLLKDAVNRGATVIMSTHQLREAMELATHVALLARGRLKFHGPRPVEMLEDPTWLYRTYGEG